MSNLIPISVIPDIGKFEILVRLIFLPTKLRIRTEEIAEFTWLEGSNRKALTYSQVSSPVQGLLFTHGPLDN